MHFLNIAWRLSMAEMPSFVSQQTSGLPHQSMEQCSNCTRLFCLFICEEINGTIKIKDQSVNLYGDNCLLFCVGKIVCCFAWGQCLSVCVEIIVSSFVLGKLIVSWYMSDNSPHTGQQSILPTQVDRQQTILPTHNYICVSTKFTVDCQQNMKC